MSNGIGRVWAVNAECGDEGRPNGVGPVWIENADQLGSKLPEPEAGDTGKVLGVLNADGDIGWVIDQSGTFTQVQADWDQTDSSQVSYIANKPSLATVATTGAYSDLSGTPTIPTVDQVYDASSANAQSGVAVASAISGKQDTINDLETIRSGAAAGATAVQPAALNDYATTSALTSGLSTKQDTISDLETIRSGAAAGATAVQPGSLATVATSGSYNDLNNKPTIPSVDQTYNAASTNAQSGTAVAQAIATIPSASYTAGDGISIDNDEISVSYNSDTLDAQYSQVTTTVSYNTVELQGSKSEPVISMSGLIADSFLGNSGGTLTSVVVHIPGNTFYFPGLVSVGPVDSQCIRLIEGTTIGLNNSAVYKSNELAVTYDSANSKTWVDEQDITVNLPVDNNATYWYKPGAWSMGSGAYLSMHVSNRSTYKIVNLTGQPLTVDSTTLTNPVTISYTSISANKELTVKNPLPASAVGDADKVLTVNAQGAPEWATAQSGSSYTAGAGIYINGSDVISVSHDNTLGNPYPQMSDTVSQLTNDNDPSNFAYYDTNNSSGLTSVLNTASPLAKLTLQFSDRRFYDDTLSGQLDVKAYVVISGDPSFTDFAVYPLPLETTFENNRWVTLDQEITVSIPVSWSNGWTYSNLPASWRYISVGFGTSPSSVATSSLGKTNTNSIALYPDVTFNYPDTAGNPVLAVTNPVPNSEVSDAGRILTVNAGGAPAWGLRIQQVNALPANPDANTLYLIPEA